MLERKEDRSLAEPGIEKLYHAFALLQEKWVLFIVHSLLNGPQGFNEISRRAQGVNTTTLSQRLSLLEQAGLVIRTVHSTIPPRTSYELTESGLALQRVIGVIGEWGDQFLNDDNLPHSCPPSSE